MPTTIIDFPGVQVEDKSQPINRSFPFGVCYMLGSATKGTSKVLVKINDLAEFRNLFGTESDSDPYVNAFFQNANSQVDLMFYRVNEGEGVSSEIAIYTDFIEAIQDLDPTLNPGGILIAPEFFINASFTDSNRLAFTTAVDKFCDTANDSYWIAFVDTKPTHTLATEVVTDRKNNLISLKGNLFTYAPCYYDSDDEILVPSAAMAAITLSLWSNGEYYLTPAGSKFPIQGIKSLVWNPSKSDLTLFHNEGVNAIRYFNNISSYVPYDSISVSSSVEFFQLNSVVCYKVVAFLLYEAVFPLVHSSLFGTAEALTSIEAVINKALYDAWVSGYLVGRNATEAFDVVPDIQRLPNPNSAIVNYQVSVRPSYSIQKIVIYLQNVLAQPLAG